MAKEGNITQASAHIEVAFGILEKLVKTEDPNDRTKSLLAAVLNERGELKKAQGDETGAQACFDRAQKLYAELSAGEANRWLRGAQAAHPPAARLLSRKKAKVSNKRGYPPVYSLTSKPCPRRQRQSTLTGPENPLLSWLTIAG